MKDIVLTLGFLVVGATGVHAQMASDSRPVVTTTAEAEVRRAPDHATLAIGVTTQDSTATAAANSMNRALAAVYDTLIALGLPRDSLPTRRFTIQPEYSFEGQRQLIGYSAQASVVVTLSELPRIGVIIESALSAGATDVGSITFGLRDDREARNEALRMATEDARQDAAALASATGATIGDLREISTGSQVVRPFASMDGARFRTAQAEATVVPMDVVISATVTASWYLRQ